MESKTEYRPSLPALMEALFDTLYLLFDLVAGILFLALGKGESFFSWMAALAFLLGGGDAFHLVPRIILALRGPSKRLTFFLDLGLLISSITMTLYYLLLLGVWSSSHPGADLPLSILVIAIVFASLRILVCLFPQNHWFSGGNMAFSLTRNLLFLGLGIDLIVLFFLAPTSYPWWLMSLFMILSFLFYFPVTLLAKKHPKVGMLMIPKTLAYIGMISLGLALLF